VVQDGDVVAGDSIEPVAGAAHEVTGSEITRLSPRDREDLDALNDLSGRQT
jgi:MOSC domain-containing protein YiiM